MTEQEWNTCTDPEKMLEYLRGKITERQGWLFSAACDRRFFRFLDRITNEQGRESSRRAVELFERVAEGIATVEEVQQLYPPDTDHRGVAWGAALTSALNAAESVAGGAVFDKRFYNRTPERRAAARRSAHEAARATEQAVQCELLRCIVGNPARPVTVSPPVLAWREGTVVRLALAAYEERRLPEGTLDPALLGVLADALEEAGCTDQVILGHLRGPGPHARGCFVLDCLLGKS
jgi:hypothetical protein